MTRPPSLLPAFVLLLLFAFACGSKSSTGTNATPSASAAASTSASAVSSAAAEAKTAEGPALDPALAALVAPALSCKLENGRLVSCPTADEFRRSSAEPLEGEKGDDAVFSLVVHPNERYRLLGVSRTLHDAKRHFAKKDHADALVAQIERETNEEVRDHLAAWAGDIDAEKLGLTDKLKALGTSTNKNVRRSMAYRFLFHNATPLGYAIVGPLLSDAEKDVRSAAVTGLHNTAVFGASPGCKLLEDALGGQYADKVVWSAAGLPRCPGLQAKALAYVDKKTADPTKVTNEVGIDYSLATSAVCDDPRTRGVKDSPTPTAATKSTAFQVAVRLTSKAVPDPNTRRAAMSALVACDPARAKTELAKLEKDADSFISGEAKKKLEDLAKKK